MSPWKFNAGVFWLFPLGAWGCGRAMVYRSVTGLRDNSAKHHRNRCTMLPGINTLYTLFLSIYFINQIRGLSICTCGLGRVSPAGSSSS